MSYQQEIAEGYFLLARPVAVIRFFLSSLVIRRGTGIRGLMRGMTTLPKVTRSYYWSETKLEDPR